ncbi:DUF308 domain-containing protein [Pendulispora brunnea]|uniref:DUF308 domain-containing protein n=1 Tax=Pendulispora brunnea TaxID=2905690 RepID=A0ABZ2JZ38_9BACT
MGIAFIRSWKAVAFRGGAGLLFGLVTLVGSGFTLPGLALLFGLYTLLDGAFAVLAGSRTGSLEVGWLMDGLLGMAIGAIVLLWIGMTLPTLVGLIAFWSVASALLEMLAAMRLRNEVPGELSLTFAWVGSLVLGVLLLFWPSVRTSILGVVLASYALLFGASMLALALRLRKLAARFESTRVHAWRIGRHGRA